MNRRGFLGLLSAAMASAALDPERLLWIPGAKSTFLPPSNGWFTPGPLRAAIEFQNAWGTITSYAIYDDRRNLLYHGSLNPVASNNYDYIKLDVRYADIELT